MGPATHFLAMSHPGRPQWVWITPGSCLQLCLPPQQPTPQKAPSLLGPHVMSFRVLSDTWLWVCSQMDSIYFQGWGLNVLCLCFKIFVSKFLLWVCICVFYIKNNSNYHCGVGYDLMLLAFNFKPGSSQLHNKLASPTTFPASLVLAPFALDSLPSAQEACVQPPPAPPSGPSWKVASWKPSLRPQIAAWIGLHSSSGLPQPLAQTFTVAPSLLTPCICYLFSPEMSSSF